MIQKPNYADTPAYCHPFFDLVEGNDLIAALESSRDSALELMASAKHREDFAYAPGKWTVKEVFRHILDGERIYVYRALRFSRFDPTDLPGFEEDDYILNARTMQYSLADLREEFVHVRGATIALFRPMTDAMLDFKGTANGATTTARGIGYMAVGHCLHHCRVVRERYLQNETR
jgi:hypothetical protein